MSLATSTVDMCRARSPLRQAALAELAGEPVERRPPRPGRRGRGRRRGTRRSARCRRTPAACSRRPRAGRSRRCRSSASSRVAEDVTAGGGVLDPRAAGAARVDHQLADPLRPRSPARTRSTASSMVLPSGRRSPAAPSAGAHSLLAAVAPVELLLVEARQLGGYDGARPSRSARRGGARRARRRRRGRRGAHAAQPASPRPRPPTTSTSATATTIVAVLRSGRGGGSAGDGDMRSPMGRTPGRAAARSAQSRGTRRATIIDSSASSGGTLNSSICSRASKTASIRREALLGGRRRGPARTTSPRSSSLTSSTPAPELQGEHVAVDRDEVHQAAVDHVEDAALGPRLLRLLEVAQGGGVLPRPAAPLDHAVGTVEVGLLALVVLAGEGLGLLLGEVVQVRGRGHAGAEGGEPRRDRDDLAATAAGVLVARQRPGPADVALAGAGGVRRGLDAEPLGADQEVGHVVDGGRRQHDQPGAGADRRQHVLDRRARTAARRCVRSAPRSP